ncbi:MAG: InlB B-repeat-containing protein, partial [Paludibacteraceae bacterium]|nr:InlB B-repeat-containing protein [Paludibacteraceae bacterium]
MRSKIRKVTWLVWVLLMLPVAESMAATFGANEGGVKWSYDTDTHCLTISPRGSSGTVNRKEYANGVTADYGGVWNYGNSGTPAWRTTQRQGGTSYNLQNLVRCVIVEEGVTRIGAAAFYNFQNLQSVTLPSSLVSIGVEAFRKTGITQLNLPENVQYIGDRWITDCFDLELITVHPNNQYFKVDQIYGALFTYDMTTLVRFPIKRCVKEVRIPEGVKKMATDAMYQLDCVEEIILPSTLDTIQYAVFDWCNNLKTIRFSSEFPPVFSDGYNLNPGDSWNYNQLTSEGQANRNNLMIYMPCIPDSTFDERTGEYVRVTQIDAKRISGWLADFVIVATPVEETVSGTPVSTDRGIAWVETKRTCDNDTTKIIAEAREGSRFIQWRQGSNGFITKENPYVFTAGVSDTFYAYFAKGEYGVTALVNDTSLGVTSGSGIYASETEVTLTATPKSSCAQFVGWSDGVTTAERTLTVGVRDTTVTAIFTRTTNKVSASANQYGTVSIYDLNGNVITSGSNVTCGDSVVFVATPNEHCSFVNWNNNASLTKDNDTVAITDEITRRGIFVQDSFLVTFYNVGNVVLCKEKYVYGETPSCTEPEDITTTEYTYEFKGWNPEVAPVSGEATYYAVYDTIANPFDFITVVEGNQTKTKYKFGESVATPANPNVKEGYVFNGWFDALRNGEEISFPFNMPAKDTIAYAVFTPDTFILTYKTFDSTTVITTQKYAFGEAVNMLPGREAPAREGYTFKNWSSTFQTMPARDTFVAAVYTVNTYHITFKDIDGTTLTEYDVQYGESVEDYSIDKEGYTCDGWLNNGQKVNFPFNMPAEDVTLVANCSINTYSLSFWADPDTEEPIDVITDDFGAPIDATGIVKPEKTGYTFDGWDKEIPTTMPAENIDFIALWSINIHEVTFKKNENEIISSEPYEYGSEFNVPDDPDSVGHTFIGWDPEITSYLVPDQDLEFVAQWSVNSYDYIVIKDNGEKNDTISYPYGTTITLPSTPEKEGYTFLEWSDSTSVMPDHDVTTEAQWQVNTYNYTVIKNNGEDDETTPYNYGAEITLPSTPEQEGYTFLGWSDSTAVMPAHNVTTEALWEINQYKVTFMKNEKEVLSSQDYDFGSTFEVPANPDSIGHKFLGWNPEIVSTVVPAESLVFVAQWSRNSYNYTIVKNNGE